MEQWYATTAGIVLATTLLVNMAKRAVGNRPVFQHVPTWVYAVVTAGMLTAASSALGLLAESGSLLDLATKAVMAAAVASGFRDWLQHGTEPIRDTTVAQEARR